MDLFHGQRILDPNYGNQLYQFLYEEINEYTADKIGKTLRSMISKYEPRINMTSNDIIIEQDVRTVRIYIQYEIKTSGEINEFNLEITDADNPYRQ